MPASPTPEPALAYSKNATPTKIYASFFTQPKMKSFQKLPLVSSSKILGSFSFDHAAAVVDEKKPEASPRAAAATKQKPDFVLDGCSVLVEKIPKCDNTPSGRKVWEPYTKMISREQFQERLKKILSQRAVSLNPEKRKLAPEAISLKKSSGIILIVIF